MTERDWLIVLMVVTYFIGSIPFGLLVGLGKGIDIRQHGSKNIGASNAGRVLGHKKYFFVVFLLDLLKSMVPMLVASAIAARVMPEQRDSLFYLWWIGVGVAAMVGHIFPIYLKFKGGKGVATGAGVLLGLFPYFTLAGVLSISMFVLVVMTTRYISVASIAASFSFPLFYIAFGKYWGWDVFGAQWPLLVVSTLLAVLILVRHKENLKRLAAGTENKIRSGS
jgi:acyl phosphate:glycerol-3-phosphate acyltransferase